MDREKGKKREKRKMLYLAVHQIEEVTARVPFSMMLLLDAAQRRTLPSGVTLRYGDM